MLNFHFYLSICLSYIDKVYRNITLNKSVFLRYFETKIYHSTPTTKNLQVSFYTEMYNLHAPVHAGNFEDHTARGARQ